MSSERLPVYEYGLLISAESFLKMFLIFDLLFSRMKSCSEFYRKYLLVELRLLSLHCGVQDYVAVWCVQGQW